MALCEAALSGLPIVGTRVGLFADLAPTAATATTVGNARQLANAILKLANNKALRERMALAAQSWARAHDADWTAKRFEEIYEAMKSR